MADKLMVYTDSPVANQTQLPAKLREYYDRNLLDNAVEELLVEPYASKKSLPKFTGDDVRFSRYERLPNFNDTALVEGVTPDDTPLVKTDVETTAQDFGQWIGFTDKIIVAHEDGQRLIKTMSDELGKSAGESQENLIFTALDAGTNVLFADGATDVAAVIANGSKITSSDIKIMQTSLRNQIAKKFNAIITGTTKVGTQPIAESYIGFCHPNVVADLEDLVGWSALHTYADHTKGQKGEVGAVGKFRIIETTLTPIDVVTDPATPVYSSFFFGEESFARVSVRGKKAPTFIFKNVGNGGSEDPLDQRGSSGVKFSHAAVILNDAWLIKALSTSSL